MKHCLHNPMLLLHNTSLIKVVHEQSGLLLFLCTQTNHITLKHNEYNALVNEVNIFFNWF